VECDALPLLIIHSIIQAGDHLGRLWEEKSAFAVLFEASLAMGGRMFVPLQIHQLFATLEVIEHGIVMQRGALSRVEVEVGRKPVRCYIQMFLLQREVHCFPIALISRVLLSARLTGCQGIVDYLGR
jgi:hypothetical protein